MQVTQADEASVVNEDVIVLQQEYGENLMFHKTLLKPKQKIVEEPEQRNIFFLN